MKILHVSDLHFGAHNQFLESSLLARVQSIQPDLIVCTGDLANQPEKQLLTQALDYLNQLQQHCSPNSDADADRPRLVVVPGNHDYRESGFLWRPFGNPYAKILDAQATDVYLERENIWIFGFDSAAEGGVGGNGYISDQDIKAFHERCDYLNRTNPRFPRSFKIAAVHHHPFPVNSDYSEATRWLIMNNSGRFLSAVLFRRVDLVLHGHEHHQAQARVSSSLGANDHQTTIVSLGTTLLKGARDGNWFGVVEVDPSNVRVDFYSAIGDTFKLTPENQSLLVRSPSQAAEFCVKQWAAQSGYSYRALASVASIDKDGDARRSVECEDLCVSDKSVDRARTHRVRLPWTSGYVTAFNAVGRDIASVSPPRISPGSRQHSFETRLDFGRLLTSKESPSYTYHWYAVNAFAMNQREFEHLHPGSASDNIEFTHYVVEDPIEALTVVVKFPEDFPKPATLRVRVTQVAKDKLPREWPRNDDAFDLATGDHSLRYYDSLNIAALRVPFPQPGLSYGIEWSLPPAPDPVADEYAGHIADLNELWLKQDHTDDQRGQLFQLLCGLIAAARDLLMRPASVPGSPPSKAKPWSGHLEASFMYLDQAHKLRTLATVIDVNGKPQPVDSDFSLSFGDGIAGRAFKANQLRIYAPWQNVASGEPEYYTPFAGGPNHRVLVSFPVRPPGEASDPSKPRQPYGVFSLGSIRSSCPLKWIRAADPTDILLESYHTELNEQLYKSFISIFLGESAVDTSPAAV
jgi:3',5'-cyclic AMP phosphodiesterase CpdA